MYKIMIILLDYLVKKRKVTIDIIKFNPIFSDKQNILSALDYFYCKKLNLRAFKKNNNCIIIVILRDLSYVL